MRRSVLKLSGLAALCVLAIGQSGPARAKEACDDWRGRNLIFSGTYQPAEEAYARRYAFAFVLDCRGTQEVVTVQRPTGNLPICQPGQPVEVVGKLVWEGVLLGGHYEIDRPKSVACR